MTADVLGPAIEALEQQLVDVDAHRAALEAKRSELTTAIATLRKVLGHPDPQIGLASAPAWRPELAEAAPAPLPAAGTREKPAEPRARRSPEDEADGAVLAAIVAGVTRRQELLARTRLSVRALRLSLERLRQAKAITAIGVRAGMRYFPFRRPAARADTGPKEAPSRRGGRRSGARPRARRAAARG